MASVNSVCGCELEDLVPAVDEVEDETSVGASGTRIVACVTMGALELELELKLSAEGGVETEALITT
jgi:hypothetical protein